MTSTRITVNIEQTHRMGQGLVELGWKGSRHTTLNAGIPAGISNDETIDYLFFTSMLLFDFKSAETTLPDGKYIKGTDVFLYLAKCAGEKKHGFWSAANLAQMSDEDYLSAFSLKGDPACPGISRMDERIRLLRDAATVLLERWGGVSSKLLSAHPRLREGEQDSGGLLDTFLQSFKGYSDPLFKKVFVFLKALDATGLWQPRDPENILMPIDYHLIRLALRNGTVTVHDSRLAARLREGATASEADEHDLRIAIMDAYHEIIHSSGLSVYLVDEIFWLVGRSCCHYKRPPRCAACDFTDCTLQPSFDYACPGKCPLTAVCLGAEDEAFRTLTEPNIMTIHY